MKKLIILFLMLISLTLTGCKSKEKVPLEDVYGKYVYKECLYVNSNNTFTKESLNNLYKNKARYSLKETSFAFYESESTTPTLSIKNIEYVEVEITEEVNDPVAKKIIKKASTRYDVYRSGDSQGYSFIFNEEEVYFLEFRYMSNKEHVVWHIFLLEKRD